MMGRSWGGESPLHAFWVIALLVEPLLDPIRGEGQFEQLCGGVWAKEKK
jgi:hypothetical protein